MTAENEKLTEKKDRLRGIIEGYGSVAIAYSGGVDSSFLLAFANEVFPGNVAAFTIDSGLVPEKEIEAAKAYCRDKNIALTVIETDALDIEGFCENPPDRCYICKKALFKKVIGEAEKLGISIVAEGSNADDGGDYRPGMKAVSELGVKSPLAEAGLCKSEIRQLAKELGLAVWDKPASACLASRIAYGEVITSEKLKMIDRAEECLSEYGYRQCRVRIHGRIARIELAPDDIAGFISENVRKDVYDEFKKLGFEYVTLDLLGYRTGSMNEVLSKNEKAL